MVFGDLLPFKCEVFEYIVLNIKNLYDNHFIYF